MMTPTQTKEEGKQSNTGETGHSSAKRQGRKASWPERVRDQPGPNSKDHPAAQLQQSCSNQAVQRLFRSGALQAKLRVNAPSDPYEQEADRVAEQVMRMSEPAVQRTCACGNHTTAGTECEECSKKKRSGLRTELKVNEPEDIYEREADWIADRVITTPARPDVSEVPSGIQRFSGQSNGRMDSAPASVDQALARPGKPLEPGLRQSMEQRFGHDFSRVRVHSDGAAEQSARDVDAHAYTVGHDIVFGAGRFAPRTPQGRRLLTHELTHVVQQSHLQPFVQRQLFTPLGPGGGFGGLLERDRRRSLPPPETTTQRPSTRAREESRGSEPDISYRGHYTFNLPTLARSGREKGFVVQFSSSDTPSGAVSMKILYRGSNHVREFTFSRADGSTLTPRLINQDLSSATFDTDGDGQADVEVFLSAEPSSPAIQVLVTRPGTTLGSYTIPPPRRQIVPNRGYPMGTLPNGKQYYLQPWTFYLPHGPLFVDEDGVGVNPALEFNAEATLDAAGRSYLYAYGILAALAVGSIPSAGLGGVGVIRWLFSGTRLIAGGTGAASNVATQALEHGSDWSRYNWGSVGFDYVMGAVSYSFAKSVIQRWPAPLFSSQIRDLRTWTNLLKQQSVLALYGTLVGACRAYVSNTPTGATVGAQHTEGLLQAIKSIALQSFLSSPLGRRLFPSGFDDPKVAFLSRTLTFIVKLAVREAFGVTPQSGERQEE